MIRYIVLAVRGRELARCEHAEQAYHALRVLPGAIAVVRLADDELLATRWRADETRLAPAYERGRDTIEQWAKARGVMQ